MKGNTLLTGSLLKTTFFTVWQRIKEPFGCQYKNCSTRKFHYLNKNLHIIVQKFFLKAWKLKHHRINCIIHKYYPTHAFSRAWRAVMRHGEDFWLGGVRGVSVTQGDKSRLRGVKERRTPSSFNQRLAFQPSPEGAIFSMFSAPSLLFTPWPWM